MEKIDFFLTIKPMEGLRQKAFRYGFVLPLSHEESAKKNWDLINPTWLAEHRPKPWTHPGAKDLAVHQVRSYHLYSDPEDYTIPGYHWKTQEVIYCSSYRFPHAVSLTFEGYNPTFNILIRAKPKHIHMFIPIYQRYLICETKLNILAVEIFDNLSPRYNKI